jgi:hypothetical protein
VGLYFPGSRHCGWEHIADRATAGNPAFDPAAETQEAPSGVVAPSLYRHERCKGPGRNELFPKYGRVSARWVRGPAQRVCKREGRSQIRLQLRAPRVKRHYLSTRDLKKPFVIAQLRQNAAVETLEGSGRSCYKSDRLRHETEGQANARKRTSTPEQRQFAVHPEPKHAFARCCFVCQPVRLDRPVGPTLASSAGLRCSVGWGQALGRPLGDDKAVGHRLGRRSASWRAFDWGRSVWKTVDWSEILLAAGRRRITCRGGACGSCRTLVSDDL